MATAVSAFTPNMPWAEIACPGVVDMDGAGTSSATPQVAAAAALYLQKHGATLFDRAAYPEPWMRVEAVPNSFLDRSHWQRFVPASAVQRNFENMLHQLQKLRL